MLILAPNRQEKSLRHVAIVAKFLNDNKPKIYFKSKFARFQTSSYLISLHLSNVGEFSELNPTGPYLSLEKERETF